MGPAAAWMEPLPCSEEGLDCSCNRAVTPGMGHSCASPWGSRWMSQEVFSTCAEPPGEGSGQCRDRRKQLLEPPQLHHRLHQGQRAAGAEQHSLSSPFGFRPLSCGGSKPSAALLPVVWGSPGIKTPLEWLLGCVTRCACTQPLLTQSVTGRSQ